MNDCCTDNYKLYENKTLSEQWYGLLRFHHLMLITHVTSLGEVFHSSHGLQPQSPFVLPLMLIHYQPLMRQIYFNYELLRVGVGLGNRVISSP